MKISVIVYKISGSQFFKTTTGIQSEPNAFSIGIILADDHLNQVNWFYFLILKGGLLVILKDCMIFLSQFLEAMRMSMSTVSLLTQL